MKSFLEKLINEKKAAIEATRSQIKAATTADEVRSLGETLDKLMAELQELQTKLDEMDNQDDNQTDRQDNEASRSFNPLATYGAGNSQVGETRDNGPRATMEYRTAFMNYVQRGTRSEVLQFETRADAANVASDLGVLLPTTVVQEIIKGVEKVYGQLYSRVKKTNIKGGVKYPIGSFGATFKRITETTTSERQKGGSVTGYVEFSYLIGEIRLAKTILEATLEVPVFESELAKVIVEAYVKNADTEIMLGDASQNQYAGIITEAKKSAGSRILTDHVITFTEAEMADWKSWQTKLFAKIPLSMRALNPEFVMTANTYEANIKTLADGNNRPVYNETYNPVDGTEVSKFKGKNVVFVEEDLLKNFNDAVNGDFFGMYWVPEKAYAINSNMQFSVTRYFDHETNQYVDKALVIDDGKILDPKYLYLLKKVTG